MARLVSPSRAAGEAHAAEVIADFSGRIEFEDIPAEACHAAKLHLLDTVGCGLAAVGLGEGAAGGLAFERLGGVAESTALGIETRLPAHAAAFINGERCHALDFDDTHSGSITHVGVVVAPAAVASAEAVLADGRQLVAALVIGTEVVARIGAAAAPAYMTRGFHPTSVCGVFGAATASARLMGLSERELVHALGIAGSMSSGVFEYLNDGSGTKPIHAAWAAHGGVVAAGLAANGAEGPASVLEGRFGVLNAYFDGPNEIVDRLTTLGEQWETLRVAFKPFPACHFVHAPTEAAGVLRPSGLNPDDIARVVVAIPKAGIPLVLEPREHKINPRTPYDAKFSLQYSVAAMLVEGIVDVATYTPVAIANPAVRRLAQRVEYEHADLATYPIAFPGRVCIEFRDGSQRELELSYQLGSADNPMPQDDVLAKFRRNASLSLDDSDVRRLEETLLSLESQTNIRQALEPLSRAVFGRKEAVA